MLPQTTTLSLAMRSTNASTALKELTSEKRCPSCVVITAPDRVRRDRALKYVLTHFAGAEYRPRTFSFGEQGRSSIQPLLSDLGEPSLFEPTRFVVIRSIEQAKAADLEPISNFISRAIEGIHLILVGASLPNSPNFKKTLEKHATVIPFEELKGAELRRWAEREMRQQGVDGASDELVELALSLAQEDPEELSSLIEKLSLYLDGEQPSTEVLRYLVPGRSSASDFELADTLLSKKRGKSEMLIHQLLAQGSSQFMLLGLLTKTFVSLYRIRAMLDRGLSQQEARSALGISPWLFSKYAPIAQRASLSALSRHCEALLAADFRLKDKSIGPAATLGTLASRIARDASKV